MKWLKASLIGAIKTDAYRRPVSSNWNANNGY